MKLFLCWSGERSRALATETKAFLTPVLGLAADDAFLSTDIEKGVNWFDEIVSQLRGADAGILCLTPENLRSPWLHFEAGALATGMAMQPRHASRSAKGDAGAHGKEIRRRVCTYLHGVPPGELMGPLAAYQSTTTTREDTLRLVEALADLGALSAAGNRQDRFDAAWPAFERRLKTLHARIEETVRGFERMFDRKTFNEPLARCTAQTWVDRYVGARETRELLAGQESLINRACPPWQRDLFDQLQAELDGYAMDMKALLIRTRRFRLQADGTLGIDAGVHETCEGRRKAIRAIVSRILDPLDVPLTAEAAAWANAETFEQRKHYIHRLEHRVRTWDTKPAADERAQSRTRRSRERGTAAGRAAGESFSELLAGHALLAYEGSGWDLDRIFGYLVIERFATTLKRRTTTGAARAADAVRRERERVQSRGSNASLTPLHYALRALAACLPARISRATRRDGLDVVAAARDLLRAAPRARDRGGQFTRVLDAIETRLSPGRRTAKRSRTRTGVKRGRTHTDTAGRDAGSSRTAKRRTAPGRATKKR